MDADPKYRRTAGPSLGDVGRIEAAGRVLARHAADLLGEDGWLGRTAVIELLGAAANVAMGVPIEDVQDGIDFDLMARMQTPTATDLDRRSLRNEEIEGIAALDLPQHRRLLATIFDMKSELESMSRELADVRRLIQTQRG